MRSTGEMAAFAQFGSELDKATQAQLARGARMVELLKQGQYRPMSVADQVISIFAGVNGFLDDVPVNKIRQFEEDLLHYVALAPSGGEEGYRDQEQDRRLRSVRSSSRSSLRSNRRWDTGESKKRIGRCGDVRTARIRTL
ncbi:MAG: hypothetical protein KatS3mg082_2284 [Nitrospiraceae bacterium]|nr:MAG: hypothetical protein KatS3mg082_2284 [Nitrospiraceae bacterium]